MSSRARKLAAWGIAALGAAVIAATVSASWDLIIEQVYVWRLGSEDPKQREAAAERLIEMGSVRVAPYLIETFDADRYESSAFAGTPLMAMLRRRGVDVKTSGLPSQSGDFATFGRVQSVLGEIAKKGPRAAEYFFEGLRNEHAMTRALCVFLLGETGARDEEVLSRLGKLVQDENAFVRHVTVAVLGTMGRRAGPHLAAALGDSVSNVRRAAVYAMEEIGAPMVQELIATLKGKNDVARIYAAYVLGRIGPPASKALPDLTEILADDSESDTLRRRAATALGEIGLPEIGLPATGAAVPVLVRVLRTAPFAVRRAVAASLPKIGGPAAISGLMEILKTEQGETRALAAFTLAQIGPPAAPQLVGALAHESAGVRAAALSALGAIGPEPPLVVPAVIRRLDNEAEVVRNAAASALESFSRSGGEDVRRAAEEALEKAGLHRPRRPKRRFP